MLLYMLKGKLPWQSIVSENRDEKYQLIKKMKCSMSPGELCQNAPEEFTLYFEYCRSLGFTDNPDYSYLKSLFHKMCKSNNIDIQNQDSILLDWEQLPEYKSRRKRQQLTLTQNQPQTTGLIKSTLQLPGKSGEDQDRRSSLSSQGQNYLGLPKSDCSALSGSMLTITSTRMNHFSQYSSEQESIVDEDEEPVAILNSDILKKTSQFNIPKLFQKIREVTDRRILTTVEDSNPNYAIRNVQTKNSLSNEDCLLDKQKNPNPTMENLK